MELVEIEKELKDAKKSLAKSIRSVEKVEAKLKEEIKSIVSTLKVGDTFEIVKGFNSKNWSHYEIVGKTDEGIKHAMFNKHHPDSPPSFNSCKYVDFYDKLESDTNFKKKYEREYKLKELGC